VQSAGLATHPHIEVVAQGAAGAATPCQSALLRGKSRSTSQYRPLINAESRGQQRRLIPPPNPTVRGRQAVSTVLNLVLQIPKTATARSYSCGRTYKMYPYLPCPSVTPVEAKTSTFAS